MVPRAGANPPPPPLQHWAIVFAALTGLAFKPAGLAALALFRQRGWDAIINEDLVGTALMLASFASAALGALAGGALAFSLDKSANAGFHAGAAAALCFAVAMVMASVLSSFIETATRAVFVAWALSPGALAATHPEDFAQIAAAWQLAHPALVEAAGYGAHIAAVQMGGGAAAPQTYQGAPPPTAPYASAPPPGKQPSFMSQDAYAQPPGKQPSFHDNPYSAGKDGV